MTYLGEKTPKLGFGLMRLPMKGEEIDLEQLKEMVDRFLAGGFTYFDTAYGYHHGQSETAIKLALVDRYPRDAFRLATKLPAWAGPTTAGETQQMFFTSLERTGAGFFDFYLLHNLGYDRTATFDRFGIWDFVLEQKAKGLIKHVGFSMHASPQELDRVLTAHPEMEFVQLQINYADWEQPPVWARECYETARSHGKPVIIMEPVKGGTLASLPAKAAKVLSDANPGASQSSWALRFAASLDGLITVLSGMSNLAQMEENVATMRNFKPLTAEERAAIVKATDVLNAMPHVPCTSCEYCIKGCPMRINIPGIFTAVNTALTFENLPSAKSKYSFNTRTGGKAGDCIQCGQCEAACPQRIGIIEELKKAAEMFAD